MRVREITLLRRDDEELKAFASVELEDGTVLRGIKVIQGKNGRFVGRPLRNSSAGSGRRPLDKETLAEIRQAVLEAFESGFGEGGR